MIFVRGDFSSVQAVKNALDCFASWSGLTANNEKTEIYFGGVNEAVRDSILAATGFSEGRFPFRYLGIPLHASRLAPEMFNALILKIQRLVQHWSSKTLTYAGKIQLINSIIFGLESYWCACLLLPKSVIKQINKLCKDFFWGIAENHNRMVFKSWSDVCLPWDEGGFDVREILSWNKALMAKHLWNLDQGKGGIWASWTRLYYLSSDHIWDVGITNHHAQSFRGLLNVRDSLVDACGGTSLARAGLNLCASAGSFSVTAAYHILRRRKARVAWTGVFKGGRVVPSHGIITNMAGLAQLPTTDNIIRRGMIIINRCNLCKSYGESHRHLFFRCPYSKEIWGRLLKWMYIGGRSCDLITELHWTARRGKRKHWKTRWFRICLAACVYFIWNERNFRIFKGFERDPITLVGIIKIFVAIKSFSVSAPNEEISVINALNS
ncbi:hypothetical protein RND81_04G059600 [Saponaria officinalis]|uniref:Reverse transcriptase zinc-binding domain-containing protein n=1 Tax=Saponaria officinalis TaxID=3572 RepID=A0AAW1LIE0_SAPOF